MFMQLSRSKVHVQSKNVSYSMDTPIKRLNFGMGRSVQIWVWVRNMSILRLCIILGFIVTSYGVRRFLEGDEVAQRIIAERFDVSRSVVARLWRRYQETGEFTRREGEGRHRLPSKKEDQYLRNLALRNLQYTARRLHIDFQHAIGQRISDQTMRNRLHEGNLRARRPARGPILARQYRARRYNLPRNIRTGNCKTIVQFCSRMKADFTWVHVIDVFESGDDPENDVRTVTLWKQTNMEGVSDGMGWHFLWRPDGLVRDKQGYIDWLRYRDEIQDPIVRHFAGAIGDNFILMQDNAPPPPPSTHTHTPILLECAWNTLILRLLK